MAPKQNKKGERKKRAKLLQNKENSQKITSGEHINNDTDSLLAEFDNVTVEPTLQDLTVKADCLQEDFCILGEGSFGIVTLGVYHHSNGRRQKVALKAPHNYVFNQVLLDEAKVMINLDHQNIVKLVALQRGPLKIAIEYMDLGDVLDALRRIHFTDTELLKVLQDVASGMEYISEKKYIHMDLACRNVFMNSRKQAKIGDFGLCKYVGNRDDGVFIVQGGSFRNLIDAPEAIHFGIFSTKTDVFSMGVLTWELYFAATDEPVFFKKIMLDAFCMFGCSLPQPERCPDELYSYMINDMLNDSPKKRPSFTDIKQKLIGLFIIVK